MFLERFLACGHVFHGLSKFTLCFLDLLLDAIYRGFLCLIEIRDVLLHILYITVIVFDASVNMIHLVDFELLVSRVDSLALLNVLAHESEDVDIENVFD